MHDQEAAKLRMEQARKKAREERAEREEKERQIEEVKKQLPHFLCNQGNVFDSIL